MFRASSHTSFPCRLQRGREPFAALYRRYRTGLATKDDWASQLPPDMTPTRGRGCQYRDKPERHIGRSDGVRHISPSLQLLHDISRPEGASLQFNSQTPTSSCGMVESLPEISVLSATGTLSKTITLLSASKNVSLCVVTSSRNPLFATLAKN